MYSKFTQALIIVAELLLTTTAFAGQTIVVAQGDYKEISEETSDPVRSKVTAQKLSSYLQTQSIAPVTVKKTDKQCTHSLCLSAIAKEHNATEAVTLSIVDRYGDFSFTLSTTNKEYVKEGLYSYTEVIEAAQKIIAAHILPNHTELAGPNNDTDNNNESASDATARPTNNNDPGAKSDTSAVSATGQKSKIQKFKKALIISTIATGTLLATASVFEIIALNRVNTIEDGGVSHEYWETSNNWHYVSGITWAVTGAAAITTGVLFLLYKRSKKTSSLSVAPLATPNIAGFALQGSFSL